MLTRKVNTLIRMCVHSGARFSLAAISNFPLPLVFYATREKLMACTVTGQNLTFAPFQIAKELFLEVVSHASTIFMII
jgi:hypothetical protein